MNEKEKVIESILEKICEKVKIESINKVTGRNDMILVKTGSLEQKRGIMPKKYKLKGEKERLKDDLVERERRKGRRIWQDTDR